MSLLYCYIGNQPQHLLGSNILIIYEHFKYKVGLKVHRVHKVDLINASIYQEKKCKFKCSAHTLFNHNEASNLKEVRF